MKTFIHLNLKRFDVSEKFGGVNRSENLQNWAVEMMEQIQPKLTEIKAKYDVDFAIYLPEAHLIPAIQAKTPEEPIAIGCQSVFRKDISVGGNFGAFTSNRPATAMKQLGVTHTIIGHFEERLDKKEILATANVTDFSSVHTILNEEIKMAQKQNMSVLFCIGESMEEKPERESVLKEQILKGLEGVDESQIVIAYEPIWAIGPGKTPPTFAEIKEVTDYIKQLKPDIPVIYGGGLKMDNAQGMAQIDSLDGGLIALTHFVDPIGFYPEEYLEIIEEYLNGGSNHEN